MKAIRIWRKYVLCSFPAVLCMNIMHYEHKAVDCTGIELHDMKLINPLIHVISIFAENINLQTKKIMDKKWL